MEKLAGIVPAMSNGQSSGRLVPYMVPRPSIDHIVLTRLRPSFIKRGGGGGGRKTAGLLYNYQAYRKLKAVDVPKKNLGEERGGGGQNVQDRCILKNRCETVEDLKQDKTNK